jgi:hypothetical protein
MGLHMATHIANNRGGEKPFTSSLNMCPEAEFMIVQFWGGFWA